jgi:hypothetical protein
MKDVLQDAISLKKQLLAGDYLEIPVEVIQLEAKLNDLLQVDGSAFHSKVQAFLKRLKKNSRSILTFLRHEKVPPDNNGSERAITNVKVKTRVSGQFRSKRGANRFAILRSVIDTAIKNTHNVFEALTLLFNLTPE